MCCQPERAKLGEIAEFYALKRDNANGWREGLDYGNTVFQAVALILTLASLCPDNPEPPAGPSDGHGKAIAGR